MGNRSEAPKKATNHYIDFDQTVKDVIHQIKTKFPGTLEECQESKFLTNSRTFVESLILLPDKLEQILKTVPSKCKFCDVSLELWKHKTPKSYFLSMGNLKEVTIIVKVCPECRRAFYPSFYENGIIFVHNKFMISLEAILDLSQILQNGGSFVEAVKRKLLLLGQVEGLDKKMLETDLNSNALKLEKIVIAVMSIMLKGSDFDSICCYICGNCPKICCTDGNTKVHLIIRLPNIIVNLLIWFYLYDSVRPSVVRALPLGVAAEQNVHYFWDYFSSFLLSPPHTFLPEGVVLGL